MQICKEHWVKLRQAISDRGLDHLVAKDAKTAFENMQAELTGEDTTYDPLMTINWMIISRALESGGLYLLGLKADGTTYCPICEAELNGVEKDAWITGPADSVLKYCREQNLVLKLQ